MMATRITFGMDFDAAQQEVYRNAVQTAYGSVRAVYLHLPVQGKLVEIVFPKV